MKAITASLLAAVLAAALQPVSAAPEAGGIKKCRDAAGKWHYGDNAAAACANSKVTVINDHGIKKRVIDAPLTEAELKAQQQKRDEVEEAKEQAKRDEILLSTYAHEADIIYIRDRKLVQLESMIKASTDTLSPLRAALSRLEAQAAAEQKSSKAVSEQTTEALAQTRSQIAKHEAAIKQRRQEQETIKAHAQRDLERYRELKSGGAKVSTSTKP